MIYTPRTFFKSVFKSTKNLALFFVSLCFVSSAFAGYYHIFSFWQSNDSTALLFNDAAHGVSTVLPTQTWNCSLGTVERVDILGRPSKVSTTNGTSQTVNLTGANVIYYSDVNCSAIISSVGILSGSSTATFYYNFTTNGVLSINASGSNPWGVVQVSTTLSGAIVINDYTWMGTTGVAHAACTGVWSDATCWQTGIPGAANRAIFDGNCTTGCSPTVDINANVAGFSIRNLPGAGYTGTITGNANINFTVGTKGFVQEAGTFTCGNNSVFTDTSDFAQLAAATFSNTAGTAVAHFTGAASATYLLTFTNNTFKDVYFDGANAANYTAAGTMTVNGDLYFQNTNAPQNMTGGTIVITKNLSSTNKGAYGSTLIKQTCSSGAPTVTSATTIPIPLLEVAATGTCTPSFSATTSFGGGFTYTSAGGGVTWPTTWEFYGIANVSTFIVKPGAVMTGAVTFNGNNSTTWDFNGTTSNITGLLTLNSTSNQAGLRNGTIQTTGDVTATNKGMVNASTGSPFWIKLNGVAAQTVTGAPNANIPCLEINSTGGLITLTGTLYLNGDYKYTQALGGITVAGSTLYFDNQSSQTVTPATVVYNNVTFGGDSDIVTLSGGTMTMTVAGTLTLKDPGGGAQINSGILEAQGNISVSSSGGGGNSTMLIDGGAAQTYTNAGGATIPTGSWTINKTAATTLTLNNNLTFAGGAQKMTITSGILNMNGKNLTTTSDLTITDTLTAGTGTLTVGANWINNGTFTPNTSTVVFASGANHTISGATANTFKHLTLSANGGKIFTIPAAVTQTVGGTLTLTGTSAVSRMQIRSSVGGSQATINATAATSTQFLDIKDNNAQTAIVIGGAVASSLNSGNNTNWTFP